MVHKDLEIRKEYHKQYYKNNKTAYAYSKRLNYWRNKVRRLGKKLDMDIIDIESLKGLCAENLN